MAKKSKSTGINHEQRVIRNIRSYVRTKLRQFKNGISAVRIILTSIPSRIKSWRAADKKTVRYRSFRLQKRIKPDFSALPTSWELIKDSLKFLWRHKKIFAGIFIVYIAVYYVVVRAPVQPDVKNIQKSITSIIDDGGVQLSGVQNNVITLSAVLGSTGSTQQNGAVALGVLFIFSLVYIWALRQLHNDNDIKVRDAFYQGLTAAIPVSMVLVVVFLELFPFAFASFVYTLARSSGIFVSGFEDITFFMVTMLIGLLSFYWMTSGILAALMATLPGVYPMFALQSARKLVQYRRLSVFRRIITLPLILGFSYLVMLLISIRFMPSKTFVIAEIVQLLFVPVVLTYLYKLYRSML